MRAVEGGGLFGVPRWQGRTRGWGCVRGVQIFVGVVNGQGPSPLPFPSPLDCSMTLSISRRMKFLACNVLAVSESSGPAMTVISRPRPCDDSN